MKEVVIVDSVESLMVVVVVLELEELRGLEIAQGLWWCSICGSSLY